MSLIHALILLFLWIITSYLAIKNIEEYYQMKKPVKKQNERLGVILIVLCCLVFRSVISTYIVYVLMFNALYYIIHKIFKNKYLDKSFYLTFIIPIVIVIIGLWRDTKKVILCVCIYNYVFYLRVCIYIPEGVMCSFFSLPQFSYVCVCVRVITHQAVNS